MKQEGFNKGRDLFGAGGVNIFLPLRDRSLHSDLFLIPDTSPRIGRDSRRSHHSSPKLHLPSLVGGFLSGISKILWVQRGPPRVGLAGGSRSLQCSYQGVRGSAPGDTRLSPRYTSGVPNGDRMGHGSGNKVGIRTA